MIDLSDASRSFETSASIFFLLAKISDLVYLHNQHIVQFVHFESVSC